MWTCPKCGRIFKKDKQPHSCKKIPIDLHFKNKEKAKNLFDYLVSKINSKIGKCKIISIPCCVHLFGKYDFLAALPKKNGLEIRFAHAKKLETPRLRQSVQMSQKVFKNCFFITSRKEIDREFIGWLRESYYLKD